MKNPDILSAIQAHQQGALMTPQEIQTLWTTIARDPTSKPETKLRATELLARSLTMLTPDEPQHIHVTMTPPSTSPPDNPEHQP